MDGSTDCRLCLVGPVREDLEACQAAQSFGLPVLSSETGLEYLKDEPTTVFVLHAFEGSSYDEILKSQHRILGPTAIKQLAAKGDKLPNNKRPLYNLAMQGVVVCVTGFRNKEELERLFPPIHRMGGSIRKETRSNMTHLIANRCGGEKYQYATVFRVPIMHQSWVMACWDRRDDPSFSSTQDDVLADHKLKPFHGAKVCFVGFSLDETKHMQEVLLSNGGAIGEIDDPTCSHVVVENGQLYPIPPVDVPNPLSPNGSLAFPDQVFETCMRPEASLRSTLGTLEEVEESPNKRKSDFPESELEVSKRRRSVASASPSLAKRRMRDVFKTPLAIFASSSAKKSTTLEMDCCSTPLTVVSKKEGRGHRAVAKPHLLEFSCGPEEAVGELSVCDGTLEPTQTSSSLAAAAAASAAATTLTRSVCRPSAVIDDSAVVERPEVQPKTLLVKAEWFWASVQREASVDEKEYLFDDCMEQMFSPSRRDSHISSSASRRKRRRLQETLSSLARNDSPALHKRRSSIDESGLLSGSASFLDSTPSPEKVLDEQPEEAPKKAFSRRQQVFMELLHTESNYVNILNTFMTMFKEPLENMPENESLLNNTELKIIFGNIPPIYEVHKCMLEDLRWASNHWSDDISVGSIIIKYSSDLLKAYPPFVNFFETMKDTLVQCDQTKPRFHAFLKVRQMKPECGRQRLQDLLIRPVQRLPSIILLLNDILKHTNKNCADLGALEKAVADIKEVLTHINEDKRKTECRLAMFDIFNDIDQCPADLVSSHRTFVTRLEVIELSEQLSGKGACLVLFLFTDQLEVCKKRSKVFNSLKSPNNPNGVHTRSYKPYKHVRMVPLSTIKRVVNITETEECRKGFALVYRDTQEMKDKMFAFTIIEEVEKATFLKTLCQQMANSSCTTDADKLVVSIEPHVLDIETTDISTGTLSRMSKFASQTKLKVRRAFSFNKTPAKIKRAVSSMMSPFGSSTNLIPAPDFARMRLASYTNISELGSVDSAEGEAQTTTIECPMSVQPVRKSKCTPALKRL